MERIAWRNPMNHPREYRKRRFLNWFPLGLTYAAIYMGRYNLNVASLTIMEKFNLVKARFGIIFTAADWTYAAATFCFGPLADRMGGRKSMLIGVFGAALLNLIIGLCFLSGWQTKVIVMMSLLYSMNKLFQSLSALAIVKVNSPWFHIKERGVFGGVFGIMISCGYSLALVVGGYIIAVLPWYYVFIIPAFVMWVMYAIDIFVLKNTPSEAGFKDFNTGDATSEDPDKDKPVDWNFLIKKILSSRTILLLAIGEFCTAFGRYGVLNWFVPFLKEVHKVTPGTTLFSVASLGITAGGIIGGLTIGILSDKFFHSRRPPVACIFYLMQIVSMALLVWAPGPKMAVFMIGVNCMWVFGIHGMLSGTCSMDFGGTKGASTVTGIFNGIHYVSAGLTGFLLGKMLDVWGWNAWFFGVAPFSLIGAILMMVLWNEMPVKHTKKA